MNGANAFTHADQSQSSPADRRLRVKSVPAICHHEVELTG